MDIDKYLKILDVTNYKLKSKFESNNSISDINLNNKILNISTLDNLEELNTAANNCTRCNLCNNRKQAVIGKYSRYYIDNSIEFNIDCLIVGEAPKDLEDELNLPFSGETEILLYKMLAAINLNSFYITNVIKCKTNSEKPSFSQLSHCEPYLFKQIYILKPKAILALGKTAAQTLISPNISLSDIHGKVYNLHASKVISTYHPRYILANPAYKRTVWNDLLVLKDLLVL